MKRATIAAMLISGLALVLGGILLQAPASLATWPTNMVTMPPPRTATPAPPTATPAPPTATPEPSHPIAKGVVAFPLEPEHICADVSALGVSWYATGWNLENCPFIEEIGSENAPGNSPIMFTGPNEPDLAWVMPCEVATRWHDVVEPQYGNYALASPGIAKWNRGWLPLFWECFQSQYGRQPAMAYLAIHCYSTGPDGRDCLAEFTAAAAWGMAHGLETIVSEYAALVHGNPYGCNGGCADCQTEAQGLAEARRVLDGLKRVPGILAVAWYNTRTPGDDPGAMDCNSPLISNDGSLTGFGMLYRDW